MSKPFACPECGGRLYAESTVLYHAPIDPKTGRVGRARVYDRSGSSGLVDNGYCPKCRDMWNIFYDAEGRVVEIGASER